MARTSNVYVRLEPNVKEKSEEILNQLGIPMSNAISLFLQQVILQRGLPFEVKLPSEKPNDLGELTDEQINAILEKGFADYMENKTISAQEVRMQMKKDFGI